MNGNILVDLVRALGNIGNSISRQRKSPQTPGQRKVKNHKSKDRQKETAELHKKNEYIPENLHTPDKWAKIYNSCPACGAKPNHKCTGETYCEARPGRGKVSRRKARHMQ